MRKLKLNCWPFANGIPSTLLDKTQVGLPFFSTGNIKCDIRKKHVARAIENSNFRTKKRNKIKQADKKVNKAKKKCKKGNYNQKQVNWQKQVGLK